MKGRIVERDHTDRIIEKIDRELKPEPLRRTMLEKLDECALSAKFELDGTPFNTHPQAAGILFHRAMAEILRTMMRQGEQEIPSQEAVEILYEAARQRDVPPAERVRCSWRDLALVRLGVVKCVTDNRFSIEKIVSIEERLTVPIVYVDDQGEIVTREISGQPDVLLAELADTAVILDWKLTWALPPERKTPTDHDQQFGSHVSYEGYFQQRFYALVVMRTYPQIQRVRLREYYPLRGKVRVATVTRERLEHIEREMALLVYEHDRLVREQGPWRPSPGKHCGYCRAPIKCPLTPEEKAEGAIISNEMAERYAAEREVADEVRKRRTEALKVWVKNHGPVKIKASKERREIGWRIGPSGGKNFGPYVPDSGDVRLERDPDLEARMRASNREVEEMRRRAATG